MMGNDVRQTSTFPQIPLNNTVNSFIHKQFYRIILFLSSRKLLNNTVSMTLWWAPFKNHLKYVLSCCFFNVRYLSPTSSISMSQYLLCNIEQKPTLNSFIQIIFESYLLLLTVISLNTTNKIKDSKLVIKL